MNMKKMKTIMMALVAMATMTLALTSCDDDPWDDHRHDNGWMNPGDGDNSQVTLADEADALCGEWYGPVRYTYKDGNGYSVSEFYANMRFSRYNTNSVNGVGTETDYSYRADGTVEDTQTLTFTWTILENFDIQITYDGGGTYVLDANASQKGFSLGYDEKSKKTLFSGYMIGSGDAQGNEIAFDFEAVNRSRTRANGAAAPGKTFGVNDEEPSILVTAGSKLVGNR